MRLRARRNPVAAARRRHLRRGHLLAEALCALALSGVLAVTAAVALGGARRSLARMDALASTARASRESLTIAASLLRDADPIILLGDTAVSLATLVGLGAVCDLEVGGRAIMLPPATVANDSPLFSRSQPVEPGDLLAVLVVDSLARSSRWATTVVDSVSERVAASPCGVSEGWMHVNDLGATRLRLRLRDSLPAEMQRGAPVRVARPGRLALYHAGSGEWMLGWRRCDAAFVSATCGAIQPVAGPLRSPAAGGLRFTREGTIGLTLRASGLSPAQGDSLFVRILPVVAP